MTTMDWAITVLITALAVIFYGLTFVSRWNVYIARSYARRVGLALPAELEPAVARRLAQRGRIGTYGAIVGLALGVVVLSLIAPDSDTSTGSLWLLIGAYFAGLGVAVAISAWTMQPIAVSLTADGPRVARSGAVSLADYVAPIERIGARVCVGLAVASLALLAILQLLGGPSGFRPLTTIGIILVVMSIGALVLFEVSARRMLDRAQPAGTPTELAWDDALRAGTARDIVTAPISLGLWGLVLTTIDALAADPTGPVWVPIVWAGVFMAGALGIVIAAASSSPQRHYLRRLWPDVAARLTQPAPAPTQPQGAGQR